jgi:hypothetical protein
VDGPADSACGSSRDEATAGLEVVRAHLDRLEPLGIVGAYLHGSLALGGYHHGISDQDLVVLVDRPLTAAERDLIDRSHRQAGPLLAAAYVRDATDPELTHPTWTHGWSGNRRVSLVTRAELHQAHPNDWPEVPDVPRVVAVEVTRAWRRELNVPSVWWKTVYVDLSVTSLARALVTQQTGRLCSKDEAVARLEELGVPPRLAVAIRARRDGRQPPRHNRIVRGLSTRRHVKRMLARL